MDDLENRLELFLRRRPALGQGVYIATGAAVLGDVSLYARIAAYCLQHGLNVGAALNA